MKKTEQIEIGYCDFCGEGNCYYTCDVCGKDICYDCRKIHAIEYYHSIYTSGSGDGLYCAECDVKTNDDLIQKYRQIKSLRHELDGWNARFDIKRKAAELELKQLIERNKK